MKIVLALAAAMLIAAITLAGTATARWDTPMPSGVSHVRVDYTSTDLWWSGQAVWVFSRFATNPPALPWTNGVTGAITNRLTVTASNIPPTVTAVRVSLVYTNGELGTTGAEPLQNPGNLTIQLAP